MGETKTEIGFRPARTGDAPLLLQWRSEPSVRRYQPLAPVSLEKIRAELRAQRHEDLVNSRGPRYQWIAEVAGRPAGWITLAITNWPHGLCEVGYALSSPYQGRGLMAPILADFCRDLFGRTRLHRIEARCSVENAASWKILEQAGFQREGRLRRYFELGGVRVDNFLYALLRGEGSDPQPNNT